MRRREREDKSLTRNLNPYNKSWTEDLYARMTFNVAAAIEETIQKQRDDAYIRTMQFNQKLEEEREKTKKRREKLNARKGTIGKLPNGQPDFASEVEMTLLLEDEQKQQQEYAAEMRQKYPLASLDETVENSLAPYRFIRDLRSRLNDLVGVQLQHADQHLSPYRQRGGGKHEGDAAVKRATAKTEAHTTVGEGSPGRVGTVVVKNEPDADGHVATTNEGSSSDVVSGTVIQRVGSCVRENPVGAYIVPQAPSPKGPYARALQELTRTALDPSAEVPPTAAAPPPPPPQPVPAVEEQEKEETTRAKNSRATDAPARQRGPFKGNFFIQKVKRKKSVLLYLDEAVSNNLAQLRKQYCARRRVICSGEAAAAPSRRGKKKRKKEKKEAQRDKAQRVKKQLDEVPKDPAQVEALQIVHDAYVKRRRVFRSQKKQIAFYLNRIRRREAQGGETQATKEQKHNTTEAAKVNDGERAVEAHAVAPLPLTRTLSGFNSNDMLLRLEELRDISVEAALQHSQRPAPHRQDGERGPTGFVDVSATGRWASFPLPPQSFQCEDAEDADDEGNEEERDARGRQRLVHGDDPEADEYRWPAELEQRIRHVAYGYISRFQGAAGRTIRTAQRRIHGQTTKTSFHCWRPLQISQAEIEKAFQSPEVGGSNAVESSGCTSKKGEQQQQQQQTTDMATLMASLTKRVMPNGEQGEEEASLTAVDAPLSNRFTELPRQGEDVFLHIHNRGDFVSHEIVFSTAPFTEGT